MSQQNRNNPPNQPPTRDGQGRNNPNQPPRENRREGGQNEAPRREEQGGENNVPADQETEPERSREDQSFVYDNEETVDPEDQAKVVIHVTNEPYSGFKFKFVENKSGDYIIKPEDSDIWEGGERSEEEPTDLNQYFRISRTRYDDKEIEDPKGSYVKIIGEINTSSTVSNFFKSVWRLGKKEFTGESTFIDITGLKRYNKVYVQFKEEDKCRITRTVTRYVKVPKGFGTHVMSGISYGKTIGSSKEQTKGILEKLYNYNSKKEKVTSGTGSQFKYFSYAAAGPGKEGDYIKETIAAPDYGDKWSPVSGSTNQAISTKFNSQPYFTYKAYFYRSDDTEDKAIENPLTAIQKLKQDISNKNRDLAEKSGDKPIIFEIARHTRTNNFNYYKNGGPVPPNGFEGQPAYYEISYRPSRFRVALREEDCESNFRKSTEGKMTDIVQVETSTKVQRDAVSFDLYTSSNDLEGCLGILGVLKDGTYTELAVTSDWGTFKTSLIKEIKELGEIYGNLKHQDDTKETIDKRTRVFMKVDPLPHIKPTLNFGL